MIRRIVSLHPEAIAEGREARLWYRVRSQAVEERFRLALKVVIAALRSPHLRVVVHIHRRTGVSIEGNIDIRVNISNYRHVKSQVRHIESFHLSLLRMLEARLNRANWVVKGGVNLRGWFGSRRYSEDLDLDVIKCAQHVLRERVDKVLLSRPLAEVLTTQGLEITRISKPKQTDTTQRWKIELKAAGVSVPLHTKVEFSRRGTRDEEYALEPVRPDIVRPYGIPAPTVNHYTARSAIRQKIQALAGRSETQARDVWDLDHLLRTTNADPRPLPRDVREVVPEAVERALSLGYDAFKAQVVPYLSEEDQTIYGTRDAWDRMCELVAARLEEFKS